MKTTAPTRSCKKFFALLKRLPGAEKEALVSQFTNNRTESLPAMHNVEYSTMLAAMEGTANGMDAGKAAAFDVARKRVMGCVGGYLRAMGKPNNISMIKATACNAAKVERFNDIPLAKLNSLYNAFNDAQKKLAAVATLDLDKPIDELQARLSEAIAEERYEDADKINQRLTALQQ